MCVDVAAYHGFCLLAFGVCTRSVHTPVSPLSVDVVVGYESVIKRKIKTRFSENIEDCNDFCLPVLIISFFILIFIFSPSHFFPSQTKRGTSRLSWQKFGRLFQAPLLGWISSSQRVETRGCFADIPF
jgi:hypothetical protein